MIIKMVAIVVLVVADWLSVLFAGYTPLPGDIGPPLLYLFADIEWLILADLSGFLADFGPPLADIYDCIAHVFAGTGGLD